MSIEVVVEPYSSWRQQNPHALSGPAASLPSAPRCPPGCVPAPPPPQQHSHCPPGYHRAERLYKCYPVNPRQQHRRQRLSPRLEQIIDNQLRLIHEGQQQQAAAAAAAHQQLQRTQSDIALSQQSNAFAFSGSPQPIVAEAARASGYALAHSASVSASVDQLPAAIKEVLSVADNVVPEAGKVTYINTASCNPDCQQRAPSPPRAVSPPPPPPRQLPPRRISQQPRIVYRPSSPYEVLPLIHVDRCDKNDPCNRNRVLDADCTKSSSRLSGADNNYMTIEIEISKC